MRIAIIIPTLNEERALGKTLDSVRAELGDGDLIVIADGGSQDGTLDLVEDCEVISAPRGRGSQLDAGARRAIELGAEMLLFLHADSHLPAGSRQQLIAADPQVGGGFLIEFNGGPNILRWGARLVNWRTRRFRHPLGDQGQFATADAYLCSGGFPHWPILEDTEFRQRLEKLGPLTILPLAISTDSRRFQQRGVVRTVVTNWTIWILFACGVSPQRLVSLYRNIR